MIASEIERSVLDVISPDLEKEGYEVLVQYPKALLPVGIGGYRPDAIAVKGDKKIAIEIRARRLAAIEEQFEPIRSAFNRLPNWELRTYFADGMRLPAGPAPEDLGTIKSNVAAVERLMRHGDNSAALLIGWATLEAVARNISQDTFARPQSPGRVVTVLSELGYLNEAEAQILRILATKRNRFIHGGLSEQVKPEDSSVLAEILRRIINDIGLEKQA